MISTFEAFLLFLFGVVIGANVDWRGQWEVAKSLIHKEN